MWAIDNFDVLIIEIELFLFLCVISIWDFKKKKVPTYIFYTFGILVVFTKLYLLPKELGDSILGTIPGIVLILCGLLMKEHLGLGDGYAAVIVGFAYGINGVIAGLLAGMLFESVVGIILIAIKKISFHTKLPFLPFFFCGICVVKVGGII